MRASHCRASHVHYQRCSIAAALERTGSLLRKGSTVALYLAAFAITVRPAHSQSSTSQHLFYLGANQHVYHAYSNPGVGWYPEDLTAETGAPPAASGSGLSAFADVRSGNQDVFYVGTDQHLYQLFSNPGVGWYPVDLTTTTGAPPAAAGTGLSALEDVIYGNQDVFYVGTNQHVYQLYSNPGVTWYPVDLTTTTGAPPAVAGSGLTAFEDIQHGNQDVFYVGTDQHVHQFFSNPGVAWYTADLTAAAGCSSRRTRNWPERLRGCSARQSGRLLCGH